MLLFNFCILYNTCAVYIKVIYRSVDELCVDNAIEVLRKSVLPHVAQTIAMLDGSTATQRMSVTAGDALGDI